MKGVILILIALILFYSYSRVEGFLEINCEDYDNCMSCANKSKCTWCSSSKKCLSKQEISANDALCNQINLVHYAAQCKSNDYITKNIQESNTNVVPPPMVYRNDDAMYSAETVMANVSDLRKEVYNLQQYITRM